MKFNKQFWIVFLCISVLLWCFREEKNKANPSGIPEFWLTIFKNVGILAEMVQEHDEPILKHLIDVKVILLKADPMVKHMLNNQSSQTCTRLKLVMLMVVPKNYRTTASLRKNFNSHPLSALKAPFAVGTKDTFYFVICKLSSFTSLFILLT